MGSTFLDGRLTIKVGDLTEENVDAIVNAANWTLLGGGGVDGAIHRRGGPEIYNACKRLRETELPAGLPTGQAVITPAGKLPSRFVIHTVGPVYGQNDRRDAELLADSYRNSLWLAVQEGLTSIAFPSISTGAFGYPKHEAAPIVASTIRTELDLLPSTMEVALVFFSESDAETFVKYSNL
jgi:O-acetyl-ADP-ribose deacetylase (regulator of RNase III)